MVPSVFFVLLLGVVVGVNGQWNNRGCDLNQLNDCKDSITRNVNNRRRDISTSEAVTLCRRIREDFGCLVQQTRCLARESDRKRNGDIIRKGLVYIRDDCDTRGEDGLSKSDCFKGDEIKRCENSNPFDGYSTYDTETCRRYDQFQECVMHFVQNSCKRNDEDLMSQYLVNRVQDLAWVCEDTKSQDNDRNRDRGRDGDRRYNSRDREYDNGYRRDDRNDQDRDRGRDYRGRGDSGYGSRDRYDDRDRYDRNNDRRYDYDTGDVTCCRNERCDRSRMDQCKNSLVRVIDNRNSDYVDSKKCRRTRDDFNCLLWQTACQQREERERMSDIFHRARDFISKTCDTFGRWRENSCYKSTEMQRCEDYLKNNRGGPDRETCSLFNNFRDCMAEELRRKCTHEDELLQGAYLIDKAQELSWQCQNPSSSYSRGNNYGYSSFDRRDPYGNDGISASRLDEPVHLSDEDEMCLSQVQDRADNCKSDFTEKRRTLARERNFDYKIKQQCCSVRLFRKCVQDALRDRCRMERSNIIRNVLGVYYGELESADCRRIYDSDCDGAYVAMPTLFLAVLLPLLHAVLSIL